MIALRGTPLYLAPELWNIFNKRIFKMKYDPLATDVYALGKIILELFID